MVLSKKIIKTRKNLIKILQVTPGARKVAGLVSLGSVLAIAGLLLSAVPVASAACSAPATTYGTDSLSISTPVATNYDVWVRMQVPSAANSSIMLQVDGGTCYNVGGGSAITPNNWTWVNYQNGSTSQVMQSSLTASSHSLEFIGTNPGVEVDSVLLLANGSCVPTGTGTNCTTGQPSPTTPTNVTATATSETSVTVKWTGSSPGGPGLGVGGYYILRGGTKIATVNGSATTSYTDTTVSGGTNYAYTIEAYDTGSTVSVSPPSSPAASVTTPAAAPATPSAVSAKANNASSVTVNWTGSTDQNGPGLAGYYILRGGTKIGSVNTTTNTAYSYTDTTAAADTTYSYTIEAYDKATPPNVSAQSSAASVTTPNFAAPTVPTGVQATANSATNVTVAWTASTDNGGPGIGGYNVYRNGTLLGGATTSTYTDTTAVAGTTYSYTIAAFDKATPPDVSAQSTAGTVTTPKTPSPTVPTGVKATANTPTSVTLTWSASTDQGGSGLAGYDIFRNGTQVASISSNSTTAPTYTDTKAVSNTTYSYTIAAFDKATPPDVSAQSTAANVTTPKTPAPTTPTGVTAKATSGTSVTISWTGSTDQAGPGVAGYYIIRNGVNIGHIISSTTTNTAYTDSTASPSTTYSYTIEAYDSATPPNVSAQSSAASVTTPAVKDTTPPSTPTNLMASPVSISQINLTWTASTDNVKVSGYDIYRNTTSGGTFALVGTATTNSYGDTNLNAKTTYYYYIVAFDTAQPPNKSANSATVNATPKSPTTNPTTATVEGTVTEAATSAALTGVAVSTGIRGTAEGAATATTNAAGQYVLSNITTKGYHSYNYTLSGYQGIHFRKTFPAGINTVNESLQPQAKHHRNRR